MLLLQGPMGPFFWRLKLDLEAVGAKVFKVNFCPGDQFYYPFQAICYRGKLEDWPNTLSRLLARLNIDAIFLFGDCRYYHKIVPDVVRWHSCKLYVFEEGYLRPDFITLEQGGVNNFSSMSRDPSFYRDYHPSSDSEQLPHRVSQSFSRAAFYAIIYALANALLSWRYPYYRHHRSLSPLPQAYFWLRAGWRKYYFAWREKKLATRLFDLLAKRYFLVPLQTHNDAQVSVHSGFSNIEEFIEAVIFSFAGHAKKTQYLVFKHHPLDRGYSEYGELINKIARNYDLKERVFYVHDVHLPTLLDHALGTVVINSTVGLSSILHNTPVCVLGDPIYNIPGLTYQGYLNDFWCAPGEVDQELFKRFRAWLVAHNQANGNFYRPLPGVPNHTGVVWPSVFDFANDQVLTQNISWSKAIRLSSGPFPSAPREPL